MVALRRGFGVVEVLIALALLGGVFLPLSVMLLSGWTTGVDDERRETADALTRNMLHRFDGLPLPVLERLVEDFGDPEGVRGNSVYRDTTLAAVEPRATAELADAGFRTRIALERVRRGGEEQVSLRAWTTWKVPQRGRVSSLAFTRHLQPAGGSEPSLRHYSGFSPAATAFGWGMREDWRVAASPGPARGGPHRDDDQDPGASSGLDEEERRERQQETARFIAAERDGEPGRPSGSTAGTSSGAPKPVIAGAAPTSPEDRTGSGRRGRLGPGFLGSGDGDDRDQSVPGSDPVGGRQGASPQGSGNGATGGPGTDLAEQVRAAARASILTPRAIEDFEEWRPTPFEAEPGFAETYMGPGGLFARRHGDPERVAAARARRELADLEDRLGEGTGAVRRKVPPGTYRYRAEVLDLTTLDGRRLGALALRDGSRNERMQIERAASGTYRYEGEDALEIRPAFGGGDRRWLAVRTVDRVYLLEFGDPFLFPRLVVAELAALDGSAEGTTVTRREVARLLEVSDLEASPEAAAPDLLVEVLPGT